MKKFISIILLSCFSLTCVAHAENENTYVFEDDQLTIHLTAKTMVDLLRAKNQLEEGEATMDLNQHLTFVNDYFNGHVDLKVNDQKITLKYLRSDLASHESFLFFRLVGMPARADHVELNLSCFTEIYEHPYNFVRWKFGEVTEECQLDKEHVHCSWHVQTEKQEGQSTMAIIFEFCAILFLAILWRFYRKYRRQN